MRAAYVILARYAEYASDRTVNIVGGDNDQIVAHGFPWMIPILTAAIRLEMTFEETQKGATLHYFIVNPKEEIIAGSAMSFGPSRSSAQSTDYVYRYGVVAQIARVVIPAPGPYQFRVIVGSDIIGAATFNVATSEDLHGPARRQIGETG